MENSFRNRQPFDKNRPKDCLYNYRSISSLSIFSKFLNIICKQECKSISKSLNCLTRNNSVAAKNTNSALTEVKEKLE